MKVIVTSKELFKILLSLFLILIIASIVGIKACLSEKRIPLKYLTEQVNKEQIKGVECNTDFVWALINQDVNMVRSLIEKGIDINCLFINENQYISPLLYVIDRNNIELANILVEECSFPTWVDSHGNTPLLLAIEKNYNDQFIKRLIDGYSFGSYCWLMAGNQDFNHQNNNGNTALMTAIIKNNTPIVQLLVEKKQSYQLTNSEGKTALILANTLNNKDILNIILEKYE